LKRHFASLLVLTLTLACADVIQAQTPTTPPNEPRDFSAYFHASAAPSTIVQLVLQSVENPAQGQVQWRPGLEKGDLFMDFTNMRFRVDFAALDGTPQQTEWFFFDKYKEYTMDRGTGSCQMSLLEPNFITTQFWTWLQNATLTKTGQRLVFPSSGAGSGSQPGLVNTLTWEYIFPDGSPAYSEELTTLNNSEKTPVSLYWKGVGGKGPALLTFDIFTSGQPDASVFSLPAACTE
jgi:hypothetical protein